MLPDTEFNIVDTENITMKTKTNVRAGQDDEEERLDGGYGG